MEKPDAIVNLVDASNIERNLYLTTQLLEICIPVVVALNMMDIVAKRGDTIDVKSCPRRWACRWSRPPRSMGKGTKELMEAAKKAAAARRKAGKARVLRDD